MISQIAKGTVVDRRRLLLGGAGAGLFALPALTLTLSQGERETKEAADQAENPLNDQRVRLAHLLRRAGFGASPTDLDQYQSMGYEATVDWLLDYANQPDSIQERLDGLGLDLTKGEEARRWWLVRMRYTTRPLQERMTLFLHGLVTSGFSKTNKVDLMLQQNELLRTNATGSYRDLLLQVSSDPAMLYWLDGNNSRRQHPNENYARELMELFSIGIGRYTEDDVRQAARAFTGWYVQKDATEATFNAKSHDPGVKTFMGQKGNFDGAQIIDIILGRREAAEFLGRKLWSYFAYPNPEPEQVALVADALQGSGYSLGAAMRTIFLSDGFSSPRAYRAVVRGPVDLVIGTLRVLGLETDGKGLPALVRGMGQDVLNPPNVAGWPGGQAWLNSATWLQRMNFANGIATRRKTDDGTGVDLMARVSQAGIPDAQGLRDHLVSLLLDGQLDPDSRAAIDGYLNSGEALTRLTAASLGHKGRGLLYLLLASPEYQLV